MWAPETGESHRIPVRESLSRVLAYEERAPFQTLNGAIAVVSATSYRTHSSSSPALSRSARAPRPAS